VLAIYSTFLQRGYDQLIHDVALQNLPVVFALDRAGLVGADGPTHAGAYDIAYLRCIPNLSLLTPADEDECRQALYTAFLQDHPVAVRYPRGSGVGRLPKEEMTAIPFGKGEIRRETSHAGGHAGRRIAILAFGTLLYPALAAAGKLDATVANMRFVKPLDVALVTELARRHDAIVTVEEGTVLGGAGSAVLEALAEARIEIPVLTLGLPDVFTEHGDPARLLALYGLDAAGIEQSIRRRFGAPPALVRSAVGL
jgi:1-deoxy-D-xylulose-5-phosphate synthase